MKHKITWSGLLLLLTLILGIVATTTEADARRGGGGRSFGGSRRSYGGYSPNRSPASSSYRTSPSYRSRSTPSFGSSKSSSSGTAPRTSFGGRRLSSSQEYTRSYGIPRRTERLSVPATGGSGLAQNYTVHRYGGLGDGFMMGYLTGASSWLWSMPFHPAFYFSRPYYVPGANGQMEVYPPTFSWTKLIVVLLVVGGLTYVVVGVIRRRRNATAYETSRSSFG